MCVYVCVPGSVSVTTTFECLDTFGMVGHLDHIQVKFEYQGHWIKVKVAPGGFGKTGFLD